MTDTQAMPFEEIVAVLQRIVAVADKTAILINTYQHSHTHGMDTALKDLADLYYNEATQTSLEADLLVMKQILVQLTQPEEHTNGS